MIIRKAKVKDAGACNFCNRGCLNPKGVGLIYPYNEIYTLKGVGNKTIMVNVCEDCLSELKRQTK